MAAAAIRLDLPVAGSPTTTTRTVLRFLDMAVDESPDIYLTTIEEGKTLKSMDHNWIYGEIYDS